MKVMFYYVPARSDLCTLFQRVLQKELSYGVHFSAYHQRITHRQASFALSCSNFAFRQVFMRPSKDRYFSTFFYITSTAQATSRSQMQGQDVKCKKKNEQKTPLGLQKKYFLPKEIEY
jgi:hypothetical protein